MVDYTNPSARTGVQAGTQAQVDEGLRSYMLSVYNTMGIGLALTGLVAYFFGNTPVIFNAIAGTPLQWVLMFAPLIFVFFVGAKIMHVQPSTARILFYSFAAIMGASFWYITAVFAGADIARAFFITAASFGALSLWGYTSKKDLTGIGNFCFIGLIGIIIASVVNLFMKSPAIYYAISYAGVLIFAGLTAYDTQKIKRLYYQLPESKRENAAVFGALNLYLDFINLMLFILRIIGDRR